MQFSFYVLTSLGSFFFSFFSSDLEVLYFLVLNMYP